jgi:VWFA-related protein
MRIVPLLVLVLALSADGAVSQPAPPGTFEESVDVRVVNVEAVVTNAKGERVRGLTAADFRLRVDGKEVPVDLFSEIAEGRTADGSGEEAPAGRSFLIFIDEAFSIAPQRDAILRRMAEDLLPPAHHPRGAAPSRRLRALPQRPQAAPRSPTSRVHHPRPDQRSHTLGGGGGPASSLPARKGETMRAPLALLCVLAAGLAGPAKAAGPAPSSEPLGESVDVRVVNVEAVVTDRRGERVQGLTAADFRLLVDGKEVPVELFNEVPAPEKEGRSFLVFLDESFALAAYRDEVLRGLETQLNLLGPRDRMAIVAFDGKWLTLLSGWTGDRATLRSVIARAQDRPTDGDRILNLRRSFSREPLPVRRIEVGFGAAATASNPSAHPSSAHPSRTHRDGDEEDRMRALLLPEMTKAISAAAAAMRTVPAPSGRKVMILLSGGWPFPEPQMIADDPLRATPAGYGSTDPRELFVPIVETANLLGYTLYPVEVHGTDPNVFASDTKKAVPASNERLSTTGWEVGVHDALRYLARETGGQALLDSDRLEALTRIDADTRAYYSLGFSPAWRADDQRHKIRVELRRRGPDVRSRAGFSDLSEKAEAARKTESMLLWKK